jgi:hypothetical protein
MHGTAFSAKDATILPPLQIRSKQSVFDENRNLAC